MTNALDPGEYWEPCIGKPKSSGHGEYGFCQAGISTAVDEVSTSLLLLLLLLLGRIACIEWMRPIVTAEVSHVA